MFYTFDCLEKNIFKRMKKQLRKDVEKVKAGGPGNAERMVLLFLTHPRASIPKELHEVFAYGAEVSRFYREYGGPAEVLKKARQELGKFWRNVSARRVTTGVYAPGAYQGIEVRVPYWLAEV